MSADPPRAEDALVSHPSGVSPTPPPDDIRYRTIFEHAPDAILVLDLETGFFIESNQHTCDLLGYTPEEFERLTPGDISVDPQPDGQPAVEKATAVIGEAAAGGRPAFEWLLKDKAGEPVEVEIRLIRMPPLERTLVLGTMTDIRARKRADAELARREREFRTLAENSPDWIVRLDLQLRRTYVNPAVLAASRSEADDLLGKTPVESFPESPDMATWEALLRRCLESGEPETVETETNLDLPRVLQTTVVPERDAEGRITSLLSVTRDVTSVRRAIDAEVRLASIVESANDAVLSSDLEGRITSWNPGAERLFGWSAAEVLGGTTQFLFEGRDPGERNAIRGAVLSGQTISGHPGDWPTKAGLRVHTSTTYFPLRDAGGRIIGIASIARDVTEERAARARLEQSEQRLRTAFEAARIGAWSRDPATGRLEFSDEAAAIYHRPPAAMPTSMSAAIALFHPDDRPGLGARVVEGIPAGSLPREYRIALPDGSYRWISGVGDLIRDPDSGVVSGLIIDIHERKLAEEAIRESEEQLRQVVESVSAGVWVWDGRRIILVNTALERMTGYSREELLAEGAFQRFIGPEDSARMIERAAARLRGEPVPEAYEIAVTTASGDTRHWELVAARIDFRGAPSSIVSAFDITDRKLSEGALRESEARFRTLVNAAAVGMLIFDGQAIVMANPEAGAIFGVDPERLVEPGFLASLIDAETRAAILARGAARARGEYVEPEFSAFAKHASGREIFLQMNASLIELGGKPAALITLLDMTERRQAEESLRASEARFRSLVDNSPDFITRIGADMRHEFVNLTAQRMAGLEPANVIGRRSDELGFPPEIGALWFARQKHVFETGERIEFEYTLPNTPAPGETGHRRARYIPEIGDDGKVHHVLSIVTDITAERTAAEERRRLDQQMQHAQKLESLGVLAGGIAHDFNNLLVAILGNAGLALLELPPESPARQTVEAIETAAQRAAELTRQMLAYSGKGRFIVETLSLSRVVEEMAHLLEVSVSKRAVLKYRFAENLPSVEADATQIRQVIMNLIINASDAIGDRSGVISVSTGMVYADHEYLRGALVDGHVVEGDYIYLEVADTGVGMDAETQARIFDPFFTTKFTGRGLGLAAVLGIVRGHQGAIKLYSEPGRGTTFKVLFPASGGSVSSNPTLPEPAVSAPREARTVLVVDDDETVRTVTRRILEHAGFSVLLAPDGAEGVRIYAETDGIDVVLLDMTMPRMDGEETFRELRRVRPGVRVILTSGYNEQDATERFAGKGLAGFIQKPYRPAELMARIEEAMAQTSGGQ